MTISSNNFYPAHDTAMSCIDQVIDFTSDIESEYALLRMRGLYQVAPELAEVASLALTQIQNLIDSGNSSQELSNLSSQIQLALVGLK